MKRHLLEPLHFSLLKSLDEFARANGKSISDSATQDELFKTLRASLHEHINHEARLHGLRVESMFAYVAAAMGSCHLISEEDSGIFFDTTGDLRRPDFRIVTLDSAHMLVEVKNFHQKKDVCKPFRMRGQYLASLKRYASINAIPLRLAIYWSRWNIWTLLDAARLDEMQEHIEIPMPDAFLHNEMYLLGDCLIGTLPPLSIRLYADKSKPRVANSKGESGFTIAKACLCSAGQDIDETVESRIAWFLLQFGKWWKTEEYAHIVNGLVEYFETRFLPEEPPDEGPHDMSFRSIGHMSQMITSQYLWSTSEGSKIKTLTPDEQPNEFGVLIPRNYKGKSLKLWQFTLLPKCAEQSSQKPHNKLLQQTRRPSANGEK